MKGVAGKAGSRGGGRRPAGGPARTAMRRAESVSFLWAHRFPVPVPASGVPEK